MPEHKETYTAGFRLYKNGFEIYKKQPNLTNRLNNEKLQVSEKMKKNHQAGQRVLKRGWAINFYKDIYSPISILSTHLFAGQISSLK